MRTKGKTMRTAKLLLSILFITVFASPSLAANYFKWTDENGVTHYSARKPVGYDAEVVRISAGGRSQPQESEAGASQSQNQQQASQTSATPEPEKDEERCSWAKSTLETLRNHNRVRMVDENGQLRFLTEEEKAEQRRKAEEAVNEAC